jgi:hypothetical protein
MIYKKKQKAIFYVDPNDPKKTPKKEKKKLCVDFFVRNKDVYELFHINLPLFEVHHLEIFKIY